MVCVRVGGDDDDDCGSKGCAEVVSEREPDKATTAKTKPAVPSPFLLPPVELRQTAVRGISTGHYLCSLSFACGVVHPSASFTAALHALRNPTPSSIYIYLHRHYCYGRYSSNR